MEIKNRQRGRPRKKEDTLESWRFVRAVMVMCAYDEARETGDKHSVAVRYAVDFVKQRGPEMPISQTEVKRILAAWRPRGSQTILRIERTILTEEEKKPNRWVLEQVAMLQGKNGLKLDVPPNYDLAPKAARFTIRFAERPNYPRHNCKNRKE